MTGWAPILDADRATTAHAVVGDIIDALLAAPPETAELSSGKAGVALLLAYASEALDRSDLEEAIAGLLEQSIEAVALEPMRPALLGGFSGIAWAVEHVAGVAPGEDDDPNEAIDQAVEIFLAAEGAADNYDLVSGLVGLGIYCLERLPRPRAAANLERIAELLDGRAERRDGGITWHSPPTILPAWQREIAPDGYYNLGLAHGVPGAIGLLGRLIAADVAAERARMLLGGAVAWLLDERISSAEASFTSWLDVREPIPARTAWCYGDPGVAAALMIAARAAGEPTWERAAVDIARAAALRPDELCGVGDAGLCHGSFGLAQIFTRFFHATGDPLFRTAAVRWIDDGLGRRRPDRGVAGFQSYRPSIGGGEPHWDDDPGLLNGAAGIGLALLAACSDLEPLWDRVLLVDLPAR